MGTLRVPVWRLQGDFCMRSHFEPTASSTVLQASWNLDTSSITHGIRIKAQLHSSDNLLDGKICCLSASLATMCTRTIIYWAGLVTFVWRMPTSTWWHQLYPVILVPCRNTEWWIWSMGHWMHQQPYRHWTISDTWVWVTSPIPKKAYRNISGKTLDNARHHWELIVTYNLVYLVPLEAKSYTPVAVLSWWGRNPHVWKGTQKADTAPHSSVPASYPHILKCTPSVRQGTTCCKRRGQMFLVLPGYRVASFRDSRAWQGVQSIESNVSDACQ